LHELLVADKRIEESRGLRRRRLFAVESLDLNGVANMLSLKFQKFMLSIDRCHSRDAPIANGIHGSIKIRAVSEFEKRCHG
jgi:hypothetical protein